MAPHEFNWKLGGRADVDADSDFVTVLPGTRTHTLDAARHAMEGFGRDPVI